MLAKLQIVFVNLCTLILRRPCKYGKYTCQFIVRHVGNNNFLLFEVFACAVNAIYLYVPTSIYFLTSVHCNLF